MKKGSGEERGGATLLVRCARLASEKSVYFKCSIFLKENSSSGYPSTFTLQENIQNHIHLYTYTCVCMYLHPFKFCCLVLFF